MIGDALSAERIPLFRGSLPIQSTLIFIFTNITYTNEENVNKIGVHKREKKLYC